MASTRPSHIRFFGALVGFVGGVMALISGLVCCVVHEVLNSDLMFDRVATVLLMSAIPLILIGSVLMDSDKG